MEIDSARRTPSTATASDRTDHIEPSMTTHGESGSSDATPQPQQEAGQDQPQVENTQTPRQIPEEYRDILGGTLNFDAFASSFPFRRRGPGRR